MSEVAERIEACRDVLSPTERQVAEVVLRDPESVAFGTVARVAEASSTSGASVVRLATRLGYPGFSGLQAAVQSAIGQQLRPAAERIRAETGSDVVDRTLRAELDNVHRTLAAVAPADFDRAVGLLADRRLEVLVVAGDAETGVGAMFATALALVREGVSQVGGSDVAVARQMAACGPGSVVVALDLRRYERWVVDAVARAVAAGAAAVAVTDSPLSPLAAAGRGVVRGGGRGCGRVRQPRGHAGPDQRAGHRHRRPPAPQRGPPPGRGGGGVARGGGARRSVASADGGREPRRDDGPRAQRHGGHGRPPGLVGRRGGPARRAATRPTPRWPRVPCWPSPTSTSAAWAATCSPWSTSPTSPWPRCAPRAGPGRGPTPSRPGPRASTACRSTATSGR